MGRRIAIRSLAFASLAAGCTGLAPIDDLLRRRDALSYAQYQTLTAGLTLDSIRASFGQGSNPLEREGRIRALTYACEDATGIVVWLKLVFDAEGRLESWVLQEAGTKRT